VSQLRPFTEADLPAAHALTTLFGWPHRLADWAFMTRLGTGVAADLDGVLVGTAMAWRFGATHGAIGLIGVAPTAQRRGLGRTLTMAALDALEGCTVVLHATAAALPLYETLGFVADGTVRQHQGAAYDAGLMELPLGQRLRPIGRSDAAPLTTLDRAATGLDRSKVMTALLETAGGVVLCDGGTALGFALFRRFGHGHVIGPVVTPDAASARALIGHLIGQHAGEFIRVDVPEAAGLSDWLQQLGLADAGPAIRMVRGPKPRSGSVATYALASQAFG
jgi:ribosomal protein S18 acetylase RimI-like enzyme